MKGTSIAHGSITVTRTDSLCFGTRILLCERKTAKTQTQRRLLSYSPPTPQETGKFKRAQISNRKDVFSIYSQQNKVRAEQKAAFINIDVARDFSRHTA